MAGRPSSSFAGRWNLTVNFTSNCGIAEIDYASDSRRDSRSDHVQANQGMRVNLVVNQESGVDGREPIEWSEGPQHRHLAVEQSGHPSRSLPLLTNQQSGRNAGEPLELPQGSSQHHQQAVRQGHHSQQSWTPLIADQQRSNVRELLDLPQDSRGRRQAAEQTVHPQQPQMPLSTDPPCPNTGELLDMSQNPQSRQLVGEQTVHPQESRILAPVGLQSDPNHGESFELRQGPQHRRRVAEQTVPPQRSPMPHDMDQESSIEDEDHLEWPQGSQRRQHVVGKEPPDWNLSHWQWHSNGYVRRHGCFAEVRICLGVIKCGNPACQNLIRPNTQVTSRKRQLEKKCTDKQCRSQRRLKHVQCPAKSFHFKAELNGVLYSVWEHEGVHTHPRPPPKGRQFTADAPRATSEPQKPSHTLPRSLRPTSPPRPTTRSGGLDEISPATKNLELGPSQRLPGLGRDDFSPGSERESTLCLANISAVQRELDSPFLVESSVEGPTYLTFQTSFMRRLHEGFIERQYLQSREPITAPLSITLTDANHTLFKDGTFDMTCVFDTTLSSWVPILYTWTRQHDIAHHRPHFRHINQHFIDYIRSSESGNEFDPKLLIHSMVMPGPQRSSRAEEYADAVLTTKPFYSASTPEFQKVERRVLIAEARKADSDFASYFWQSAKWLSINGSFVPANDTDKYWRLCGVMASDTSSLHEWKDAVTGLCNSFPRVGGWMSLWLRPAIASATFPACSQVDLVTLERITGATEPGVFPFLPHSEACELVPGIKSLYLYAKDLENRHKETESNCHDNVPDQGNCFSPLQSTTSRIDVVSIHKTETRTARSLQSYQWANNSCFIDNGLELWFRAFSRWPLDSRSEFLCTVPTESFLGSLFFHYNRRLKQIYLEVSSETLIRNLSLMQTLTQHYICDVWKVHLPRDFGCSKTWLLRAVRDKNPPRHVQRYFGVDHSVTRRCEHGHSTCIFPSEYPQVVFPLNDDDIRLARQTAGRTPVNLTEYFSHVIPRIPGGRDANATTVLHRLPAEPCSEPSCSALASIVEVSTRWPQILNISHYLNVDPKQKVLYDDHFTISNSSGANIVYELVGRVFHLADHFVSQLHVGGDCYIYNDINGHLKKQSSRDLTDDGYEPAYHVYHRSSVAAETIRDAECLAKDHEIGQSLARPEPTFVAGEEEERISAPAQAVSGDSCTTGSLAKDYDIGQTRAHPEPASTFIAGEEEERVSAPAQPVSDDSSSGNVVLPGRVLQVYEPDVYVPCSDACRERLGILVEKSVSCLFCRKEWHEYCMEPTFSENFFAGLDHPWSCPDCLCPINGRWDQYMIDEYVLMRPEGSTSYFPAKILGRSSTSRVHLQWYEGNVYQDETETPREILFTSHPGACLIAYFYEPHDYTQNLGTIKWPIQFLPDAHNEHGYSNTLVMSALESSFHAVMDIVSFKVQHPILSLFKKWKVEKAATATAITRPYVLRLFEAEQDFENNFEIDILPGDVSLLEPFLSEVYNVARTSMDTEDPDHITMLAKILFRLVVIRVYLGQGPQHDSQIYQLSLRMLDNESSEQPFGIARRGHIVRLKTAAEQAALACFAPEVVEGRIPSKQGLVILKKMASSQEFSDAHSRLHLQPDVETELHFPIAQALVGQDKYVFAETDELGLAGGPAFRPREFDLFPSKPVPQQAGHSFEPEPAPLNEALAPEQASNVNASIDPQVMKKIKRTRKKAGLKGQTTEVRRSKRLRQAE